MKQCPTCKSKNAQAFYDINKLPLLLFPVDENVRYDIKQKKIESFICSECNHIFTDPISQEDADLIYGNYYRFYPYDNLESLNIYYRKPFEIFFDNIIKTQFETGMSVKNLLEIGCSSGKQLEFFEGYNLKCKGIDPSPLNESEASKIISGFYQNHKLDIQYDIIVARFVVEHINHLDEFLNKLKVDLTEDGIVFIQVPNVMEFMENNIPSFLAHEHTQYFNGYSMAKMAEINNFQILDILHENSQSICIALKRDGRGAFTSKKVEKPAQSIFNSFLKTTRDSERVILNLIGDKKDGICFYGSGLMLTWMLYNLEIRKSGLNCIVIDDNFKLNGKYLPQSDFKVSSYIPDLLKNYKTILLTLNPIYHNRVLEKLKADNYTGEIYSLSKDGVKLVS